MRLPHPHAIDASTARGVVCCGEVNYFVVVCLPESIESARALVFVVENMERARVFRPNPNFDLAHKPSESSSDRTTGV